MPQGAQGPDRAGPGDDGVGQLAHAPRWWGNLQETFCGVPGRKSEKQEEGAGESCHQRQS